MLTTLLPGLEYTAYLTSHSSTNGDSPLLSPQFIIKIPAEHEPSPRGTPRRTDLEDLIAKDAEKPWYQTLRFRAYLVLVVIAILIIVCCAGLAAICSSKYYDWTKQSAERRRRTASIGGASSGKLSNASSRLSLNSVGSGSRPPPIEAEYLIRPNALGLPIRDHRHKKTALDMKGGPQGYRPRGERRVRRMLKDPQFTKKIRELNKDPTGTGKSWAQLMEEMKQEQVEEVRILFDLFWGKR
jgi:hypothetical protein